MIEHHSRKKSLFAGLGLGIAFNASSSLSFPVQPPVASLRWSPTSRPLHGQVTERVLRRAAADGSDDNAVEDGAPKVPPARSATINDRLEYFVGKPGEFQRDLRAAGIR